jgi:hypothetical protein
VAEFFTEFEIGGEKSIADLRRMILTWASGITNTNLSVVPDHDDALVDFERSNDREEFVVKSVVTSDVSLVGGRYSSRDKFGTNWITEIVGNHNAEIFQCSVRVRRAHTNVIPYLPVPRKPYIFKLFYNHGWQIKDGNLNIIDKHVSLSESDVDLAASFITGKFANNLPIVYVSATHNSPKSYAVDPTLLTTKLAGIAHVVVEPSRFFSYKMRDTTAGYNAFNGAVGVYWPGSVATKRYIIGVNCDDSDELVKSIYEDIIGSLSNRLQSRFCSWNYLEEIANRRLIDKLKADGSGSIEKYVEAFDAENNALKAQLGDQDKEIKALERKLLAMSGGQEARSGGGLVRRGKEVELYPSEFTAIVVAALVEHRRRVETNSRLDHVLADIISVNPMPREPEVMRQKIQSLLKTSGGSDGIPLKELEEIGFDIVSDNKHTKITFSGDARYTFSLPKTPGDHRSGKNAASEICSKLFPRGGSE